MAISCGLSDAKRYKNSLLYIGGIGLDGVMGTMSHSDFKCPIAEKPDGDNVSLLLRHGDIKSV